MSDARASSRSSRSSSNRSIAGMIFAGSMVVDTESEKRRGLVDFKLEQG
jgi:hypothetical protein